MLDKRKTSDRPGVIRLQQMGAGPRTGAPRRLLRVIIEQQPPGATVRRKAAPVVPAQSALF